jgi:hypothetical protein
LKYDSEYKVGKVVEKDDGGCLYQRQASRQLQGLVQQARHNRRKGKVDFGSRYKVDYRQRTLFIVMPVSVLLSLKLI